MLMFLLEHNVEHLTEKTLFVANKDLAGHISLADDNQYISLIDVFENQEINTQLAEELLSKNFKRNITVDTTLYQNAGASITQQLALALAKSKRFGRSFWG